MEDTNAFLGRGFSFPMRVDKATGRFIMCSGEEDIRQSIRIILLTRLGERAMLPEYGSRLEEYVFDLPDAATVGILRREVADALTQWEPRIIDVDVRVDMDGIAEGKVSFVISYTVRSTNNPNNLVFPYYLYEGTGGE